MKDTSHKKSGDATHVPSSESNCIGNLLSGDCIVNHALAASNPIIEELLDLLGSDVVLLPIPRGSKRPFGKAMEGWPSFTTTKMQEPEYLAHLNHGTNVGVLLGDGRATIDLDRDESVEPFLNLNPQLRETLKSRRKRGCNL